MIPKNSKIDVYGNSIISPQFQTFKRVMHNFKNAILIALVFLIPGFKFYE